MKVFLEFPLLKREFVGLLRTRRAFWLTLFLVALANLLQHFIGICRELGCDLGGNDEIAILKRIF